MSAEKWEAHETRVYFGSEGGFDLRAISGAEEKARLIAAAPDLLSALEALDNYICNNLAGDYPTGVDVDSSVFKDARAAIAKATGSAP